MFGLKISVYFLTIYYHFVISSDKVVVTKSQVNYLSFTTKSAALLLILLFTATPSSLLYIAQQNTSSCSLLQHSMHKHHRFIYLGYNCSEKVVSLCFIYIIKKIFSLVCFFNMEDMHVHYYHCVGHIE